MPGPQWYYASRYALLRGITKIVLACVRWLPEPGAYRLGAFLAWLAWLVLPNWRHISLRNLEIFYKGTELAEPAARSQRLQIARQALRNLGYHTIEFIRMGYLPIDQAVAMVVEEEGLEHYFEALKLGRGAIGLAMHLGNWEMSGAYLPQRGIPLHAVGKEQRDTFFTQLAFPRRQRFGIVNIASGDKMSSAVPRSLKQNAVLGLLADQNGGSTGTFAPFAGTIASCVIGPAVLALRYGAPLLPTYCLRLAPGKLRMVVKPPLDVSNIPGHDPQTGKYTQEAVVELLTRINASYVEIIKQYPEQWLWGHKRWKTRPAGEPDLYL